MKNLSIASIAMQIVYCLGGIFVMICMPLYTYLYPSELSDSFFAIGAFVTLITALNPIGLICCICNLCIYLSERKRSDGTQHTQYLVWVILGPVVVFFCWLLTIVLFVAHSGGV